MILPFILGTICGGCLGFGVAALCVAAGQADARMEKAMRRHLTLEPTDHTPIRPRDPKVIHLVDRLAENAESRGPGPLAS